MSRNAARKEGREKSRSVLASYILNTYAPNPA